MSDLTDEFCAKYPDILDELGDAEWSADGRSGRVYISERRMINATNHECCASFDYDGEHVEVTYQSGDNWGFKVYEFGADVVLPPQEVPYVLRLIPDFSKLRALTPRQAVEVWKTWLPAITELLGKYQYDRTFAPGSKTESYYGPKIQKWLNRGLIRKWLKADVDVVAYVEKQAEVLS